MQLGRLGLIKHYFETGEHGRKVTMEEMKALTPEDKAELGDLAVAATGATQRPDGKFEVAEA